MTRRDRFGTRAYLHRRTRKRPSARGVRRCDASIGTWGWVRRLLSVNKTQSQVNLIAHTRNKMHRGSVGPFRPVAAQRVNLISKSGTPTTTGGVAARQQQGSSKPLRPSPSGREPRRGYTEHARHEVRASMHPPARPDQLIRTCFQSATMINPSSPLDRTQNPSPDMPNTHPPPQVRHHADGERQLARGRVHQATRALRRVRTRVRQRDHPHPRGETHDHRVAPGA